MNQGRQRLRPWLEEQIESGRYPGVMWLDEIPWKHAARQGWNIEKDASLFRNWAIHTGRYKPGIDKPDPKTWKANFRCALNSLPDVKELQDKSIKKGQNAFRVYVLLPHSKSLKRRRVLRSGHINIKSTPAAPLRNTAPEKFTDAFWKFTDDEGNTASDILRREDFSRSSIYCHSAPQGLQMSATDETEQTEAVMKIVDHLKNLEHWSPLYESERSWRANSSWMDCLCESMDCSGYTYPTDCGLYKTSSDQYDEDESEHA